MAGTSRRGIGVSDCPCLTVGHRPQHFFDFFLLPHGQGSFRPTFGASWESCALEGGGRLWLMLLGSLSVPRYAQDVSSSAALARPARRESLRKPIVFHSLRYPPFKQEVLETRAAAMAKLVR